jgi:hypothetical protein
VPEALQDDRVKFTAIATVAAVSSLVVEAMIIAAAAAAAITPSSPNNAHTTNCNGRDVVWTLN